MNCNDTWNMNSLVSPEFIRQQEELWRAAASKMSNSSSQEQHSSLLEEDSKPAAKETHPVQDDASASDGDISRLLEDCAMIEEQRRILQAIEQENRQDTSSSNTMLKSAPVQRQPSTSTTEEESSSDSSIVAYQEDNYERDGVDGGRTAKPTRTSARLTSSSSHHSRREGDLASQDQMFRMGNKNVKVKGTSHTYQSIADGKATIVQCSSCAAILQVGKTAKLVFCGNCQQVTPIETARNICVNRVGSTDAHIARSLQAQELDVAYARKTAKMQQARS
eukprot:Nitzschia sp. Nitz4//scaffold291_size36643//10019//10852//NITZ4_007762-RA/size36643-processed-gene-0.27-mRNA-1//-1//CDS//3329546124//2009//frame0